jgi:hypothetical protein
MDTAKFQPLRTIDPPRPVTADLREFGPRRIRWGTDTPQWVRSRGFRPDKDVPAVAEFSVLSMYGDWWVYCRTNLVTAGGQVLREIGLLLPSEFVKPA